MTSQTKMEELLTRKHTDLMLDTITERGMTGLPLRKISGVMVDGFISVKKGATSRDAVFTSRGFPYRVVLITIRAEYQEKVLYTFERHYGENKEALEMMYDNFYEEVNKLGRLEFDKLGSKLRVKETSASEISANVVRELFYELFKGDQFTRFHQDCCVCYDATCEILRCGHYLCLACESSMKELKCPLCREDYHRCGACKNDKFCDCYDDEDE